MTNPFAILGLPPRFDLDQADLHRRYVRLSAQNHPDRFPDALEQIEASQRSAAINDAYRQLSDPELRANALLTLLGGPDKADDKSLPPDLLPQMMETLEELERARAQADHAALARLQTWAQTKRTGHLARVGDYLGQAAATSDPQRGDLLKKVRLELNALRYFERMLGRLA